LHIFTKMKADITEKIEFPDGVEFELEGNVLTVKKDDLENKKKFMLVNIILKKQDSSLIIESKKATKKELKIINTIKAHVKNMIQGLQEVFVYKLEAVYVHFPMVVELDKEGNKVLVKNFLGEKKPRMCNILPGTIIKIDRNKITVESHNKELAGQMAANLEKTTKVRKKDRRKFQDGIYITEKCGRAI